MKTLLVALLIFTMALVSPAFAKKKKETPASNEPRIVEINAVSITISVGKSGDDHKAYKITNETQIKLDGVSATTDNLRAGMVATVVASTSDANVAKSIDAKDAPKH